MKQLFLAKEKVYKSNLHCHTTVSDGKYTPEQIKEMYLARGYNIVAYTDHSKFVPHNELSDDNFLAINSYEVGVNQKGPGSESHYTRKTWHVNFYAARSEMDAQPPNPTFDYYDIDGLNQFIENRVKEGFLACYNHPYWSLQTADEYCKIKHCFAMEIYNHNCEVADGCNGYHPQAYDEMLRAGMKIYCVSTDDNHNRGPKHLPDHDSFGGITYINSKSLAYNDVIEALSTGDFYASQGPELHEITLDGKTLTVKCSPCNTIRVQTHGRVCYETVGNGLTEATFTLNGDEEFIRIICRDKDYKDANSNAYWLK